MSGLYNAARWIKDSIPPLRWLYAKLRGRGKPPGYGARIVAETDAYKDAADINDLPGIFHYWADTYVRPMQEPFGFSNPDQFYAKFLTESAQACGHMQPVFISIGAGNCDTEVRVAGLMKAAGMSDFTIECLDMNRAMLARGQAMAVDRGVAGHLAFVEGDFNAWKASKKYAGIMANQSLHHVLELERLFDEIKGALEPGALLATSDIIGRNGHQRWPEALKEVQRFWRELPPAYRYNVQLNRREKIFRNWDCSTEAFEGIRAQDILPLLLERFHFRLFIGFANVIDVFVDRSFGPNFDADSPWDRAFIDRVQAFDESALKSGLITPTHMMAVLSADPADAPCQCRPDITPQRSVRKPRLDERA